MISLIGKVFTEFSIAVRRVGDKADDIVVQTVPEINNYVLDIYNNAMRSQGIAALNIFKGIKDQKEPTPSLSAHDSALKIYWK